MAQSVVEKCRPSQHHAIRSMHVEFPLLCENCMSNFDFQHVLFPPPLRLVSDVVVLGQTFINTEFVYIKCLLLTRSIGCSSASPRALDALDALVTTP